MGLTRFLTAALMGAAAVYLWDPENGRRRRALVRDKWSKLQNRAPDYLTRQREQVQGRLTGLRHDLAGAIPMPMRQEEPLDDATLKAKVESELFRDPTIDKGGININAVDGVVYLRGQAAHAGQSQEIVRQV